MSESSKDTERAMIAARALWDGRDPIRDYAAILVTLDHLIATVLLVSLEGDARKAIGMLHEGIVPAVEERIARYASKRERHG